MLVGAIIKVHLESWQGPRFSVTVVCPKTRIAEPPADCTRDEVGSRAHLCLNLAGRMLISAPVSINKCVLEALSTMNRHRDACRATAATLTCGPHTRFFLSYMVGYTSWLCHQICDDANTGRFCLCFCSDFDCDFDFCFPRRDVASVCPSSPGFLPSSASCRRRSSVMDLVAETLLILPPPLPTGWTEDFVGHFYHLVDFDFCERHKDWLYGHWHLLNK